MNFLKGLVVGFVMSAPIGPVAFLCFRNVLSNHISLAFLAALGASLADGLLAVIAGLGLSQLVGFLSEYEHCFSYGGGFFLILFGLFFLFHKPTLSPTIPPKKNLKAFFFALIITLINPLPILGFTAAFSAMGMHEALEPSLTFLSLIKLFMSIMGGALTWWGFLIGLTCFVRRRFGLQDVVRIHQFAAFLLIFFGSSLVVFWYFHETFFHLV